MYSTMGVFGRLLFDFDVEPLTVVTYRAIVVALTLAVSLLVFKRSWFGIERRDLPLFLLYGLIGIAGGFYLYFTALDLIGVSLSVVLLYTYPVFVVILSTIFLGEWITGAKTVSLLLTIAGVILVSGLIGSNSATVSVPGIFAALLSAVAVATHSIFGKKLVGRYSPWTILLYAIGFGSVSLLIAQSATGGIPDYHQPAAFWMLLVALAWVSTLGANLAYISSLRDIEASRASITTSIEPVFAILLAYVFFQERLSPIQLARTALILGGIFLVQWRDTGG